jgi:hypothetical protein
MGNKQKLDLSKAGLEKCIQLLGGLTELYEKQNAESAKPGERKKQAKQRQSSSRSSNGDKTHLINPEIGEYLLPFVRDIMVPLIGNTDSFDETSGVWATNPDWESILGTYHPQTQMTPLQTWEGRRKRLGADDSVAIFKKRAGTKRQKNEVGDRVAIAMSADPASYLGLNTFNFDSAYHWMKKQHKLPFLAHDTLLFPMFKRGKGCTEYVSLLGQNTPYKAFTQLPLSLMLALGVDGIRGYTRSNLVSYIGNAFLKNVEYTGEAFYFRAMRTGLKLLSRGPAINGDDWTTPNYSVEDYCDFLWDFTATLVCKLYERRGAHSLAPLLFKKFEFWNPQAIEKWNEVRKERHLAAINRAMKSGGKSEREARLEVRSRQTLTRVGKIMYEQNAIGKPDEFLPMLLESLTAFLVRIDANFISTKRKRGDVKTSSDEELAESADATPPTKKKKTKKRVAVIKPVPAAELSDDDCSQLSDSSASEFNDF